MRYFFVIIVALFLSSASSTLEAQVRLNINFNLDSQPAWGPTGYDYVENYYLPDMDIYYNVPQHRYYYYDRGRWHYSYNLPYRFRGYDVYNSYKVVVNDKNPWQHHNKYRDEYFKYRGNHDQQPIRDSRDSKYFQNKFHPEHNNWVKQQKHDNGNNNGNNKGNNGNSKKKDNKQGKGKDKK